MASVARVIALKALVTWSETKADPHAVIAGISDVPSRKDESIKAADAAFARELFFGAIKFKRKIDYHLRRYVDPKTVEPGLMQALRLGFHQLLHMGDMPAYAAVSDTVELVKEQFGAKRAGFINAVMREYLRGPDKVKLPSPDKDPAAALGIRFSYPNWLVQRYLDRFGREDAIKILEWGNTPPELFFFINKYGANELEVKIGLKQAGVKFEQNAEFDSYYKCLNPHTLIRSPVFTDGQVVIGDPAQGLAVSLLAPSPGATVLDLFASPGAKSAALAAMVGPDGQVISVEISPRRMALFQDDIKRWRLDNISAVRADASRFASSRQFRFVLADVPCSGTGTLRRNPDLRWRLRRGDIARHAARQLGLIAGAAGMLDHGGVLAYSTCSMEPEENVAVVEKFLKQNPNFRLKNTAEDGRFRIKEGIYEVVGPKHGTDSAFVAVIERR